MKQTKVSKAKGQPTHPTSSSSQTQTVTVTAKKPRAKFRLTRQHSEVVPESDVDITTLPLPSTTRSRVITTPTLKSKTLSPKAITQALSAVSKRPRILAKTK
jgi:hypothetical protein